jgi:acetyl esterase
MRTLSEQLVTRFLDGLFGLPESVVETCFGPPPVHDRGAPLDLQLHVLLSLQRLLDPDELHERGVEGARDYFRQATRLFERSPPGDVAVEDDAIDGPAGSIPVRLYDPGGGPERPGCLFFHGGGFVVGDLDGYDGFCRLLARRADCRVLSVGYRRAPEHRFPAAIEDAVAAFRVARAIADDFGFDPDRLAVAGDSAGGNIATVVCQRQIEAGRPTPDVQFLFYPKTDHRSGYDSRERFAENFYLTDAMIEWFSDQYLSGTGVDTRRDPRVSPLRFDRLDAMPPAVVATAGFDPLRDEGEAYVERLRAADVDVVHRHFDRLVHGFVTMGGVVEAAARATADMLEECRSAWDWIERRDVPERARYQTT